MKTFVSLIHGQANEASDVMSEWSDAAEETEVTFRADTSGPGEMINTTGVSRFIDNQECYILRRISGIIAVREY